MNTSVESRICQNCKSSFTIEPEDFLFYEKIKVPPPTWCPECRIRRRLAFRNERSLYKRKCDLCQQEIISMYSPDKSFLVYCPTCWHSDKWDSLAFGREYDFSRPFFEQLQELKKVVPRISLFQERVVNSPWINYEVGAKNCYLDVGGQEIENCAYNQYALKSRESMDNYWLESGEFCYEDIFCENCYKTFFSIFCSGCRDTYFSFDCRNCSNIFGCSGLRHKEYYIFNSPVSKEEFCAFLQNARLTSYHNLTQWKKEARELWRKTSQRAVFVEKSVNILGHMVRESKNCIYCWNVEKVEDARHLFLALVVKDAQDLTSVGWGELLYECMGAAAQIYDIKFSTGILEGCSHIEYGDFLFNSHYCFGSIGLRNKSYCILNKQYTKEQYGKLIPEVRKHMDEMPYEDSGGIHSYGEFFPPSISPFGYNESVANEYFTMDKPTALQNGFVWSDYEVDAGYKFSGYSIPDDIRDNGDDILDQTIQCEVSGKAYRIIPMELAFYRKFGLPIPRLAPFERHRRRLAFVAGHLQFYDRICTKCGSKVKSVYKEDEFPLVYCEACYQSTVV